MVAVGVKEHVQPVQPCGVLQVFDASPSMVVALVENNRVPCML